MRTRARRTPWLHLIAALLLLVAGQASRSEEDFLDPEVAFRLSARALDPREVEVTLTIAPGYYLYRERFQFAASGAATLDAPVYPAGKTKFDETFGKNVETYRDVVHIVVPVREASGPFRLVVTNQGCADKGLCYPPQERSVEVRLAAFGGDGTTRVLAVQDPLSQSGLTQGSVGASNSSAAAASPAPASGDSEVDSALRGGKFWPVVGVFFVAGILLSLTPCVLPMLPILSSIIVGEGARVSRGRGLALAASYSLGMALVYTALGVAAGLAGEGLAAALQNPWVLGAFAASLAALALSMFGLYELQLPSALASRLSVASQRLPSGRFAGVFAMGGVSALIVSPCVAAPLAGALVYLSQTRDVWLGGTALFTLAAGMSVPLLLLGVSAGALLPRAGAWMNEVKQLFGLMLLGVAVWTLQSVIPAALALALWGALAIAAAVLLISGERRRGQTGRGEPRGVWRRIAAAVLVVGGLMQLVGAASGGSNPLQPLARLGGSAGGASEQNGPVFTTVHSSAELDAALRNAGRAAMLDFYADWCVSCKEMERFTFVDPAVRKKMAGALLLKADVTGNNVDDRELLKRFGLFGPPGTIFFDPQGREVASARISGFQGSERFLQTLQTAGL